MPSGEPLSRKPINGTGCCCARAASGGHAIAAAAPKPKIKSRRLTRSPPRRGTGKKNAEVAKSQEASVE
jgi:hypothetical protein